MKTDDGRPCLHCILKTVIEEYWKTFGEQTQDGCPAIDFVTTFACIAEVQANFILMLPASDREKAANDARQIFDKVLEAALTGRPVEIEISPPPSAMN